MAGSLPVAIASDQSAVPVSASSLPLPTGAATFANQTTIIGHVDGIEGLLTTIDADTGTLAATDFATEAKQDTQITELQQIEADVEATNVLLGDVSATPTANTVLGRLKDIDDAVSGTLTVDGSGVTQPVSNAALTELAAAINSSKVDVNIVSSDVATGGTSAADDADFTAGTTSGTPAMGVYESTPTSVTDGDLGTVGITSDRRMKTSATVDAALPAGDNNIGNVDVASSALPTGASTSANQTTIIGHLDGVEGLLTTIDGDTGTLAGAVSGTEMQVDVVGALPTGANTIGAVNLAQYTPASGRLPVDGSGVTQPVSGTVSITANSAVNVAQMNGVAVTMGNGAVGTGVQRVTIASDSTGQVAITGNALTALQLIDNIVGTEDAAETAGGGLAMAGSVRRDTAASSSGTSGDNSTINTTAQGGLWVTTTPTTTSGCDIFRSIDLDESEEEIKATAGNLYGYYFYNAASSIRYLKFYNATAANVTVGTTSPVLTIPVPATTAAHISLAFPVTFSTAISAAVTTGLADNDTGAPGANEFILNAYYK